MSNRTLVELNHDFCPHGDEELFVWAEKIKMYLSSGDVSYLPYGVSFVYRRHHSEEYPKEIVNKASKL